MCLGLTSSMPALSLAACTMPFRPAPLRLRPDDTPRQCRCPVVLGIIQIAASYAFLIGLITTSYLIVVGRHLGNILIFRHAIRRPSDLSGEARLSYRVGLNASQSQLWQVFLPLMAIALYERTAFASGCFCAPISLAISHLVWARKHQKRLRKASPAPEAEGPSRPPPV